MVIVSCGRHDPSLVNGSQPVEPARPFLPYTIFVKSFQNTPKACSWSQTESPLMCACGGVLSLWSQKGEASGWHEWPTHEGHAKNRRPVRGIITNLDSISTDLERDCDNTRTPQLPRSCSLSPPVLVELSVSKRWNSDKQNSTSGIRHRVCQNTYNIPTLDRLLKWTLQMHIKRRLEIHANTQTRYSHWCMT